MIISSEHGGGALSIGGSFSSSFFSFSAQFGQQVRKFSRKRLEPTVDGTLSRDGTIPNWDLQETRGSEQVPRLFLGYLGFLTVHF